MKRLWLHLTRIWCQAMHPAPMWPVKGQYRCPTCMRTYPVPWEEQRKAAQAYPPGVGYRMPYEAPANPVP